jgi:hypothetical protein
MSYPIKAMRHASAGSTNRRTAQTRKDEFTAQFGVMSATSRTCQIGSQPAGNIDLTSDTVYPGYTDLPAVQVVSRLERAF